MKQRDTNTPTKNAVDLKKSLQDVSSNDRAKSNAWFFKTGKGDYGEGDKFIGITMPNIRKVIKDYFDIQESELEKLFHDAIHEFRLAAFLILVRKYQLSKTHEDKKKYFDMYVKNRAGVNNWDLVDLTSHKIIGDYLIDKDRQMLYDFANSDDIWERRISIISTFAFIAKNEFDDSLKIAEVLLHDKEDLIHKAVGWVLREVGKKDQKTEEEFLKDHYRIMPRTMLRYAIEKFDEPLRLKYLKGNV